MTTPYERTETVLRTRELLKDLAAGEPVDANILKSRAEALLKRFPAPVDIDASGAANPGVWARIGARWFD